MYTIADRDGETILSSVDDFPDLEVTDPFVDLLKTLPDRCLIPVPILKLGILTRHIEPVDNAVDAELSTADIESAATAVVSSKTLAAVEYLLYHHADHLDSNEKQTVGVLCDASDLNRPNEYGATEAAVVDAASAIDDEDLAFLTRESTQYVCESCGDVFNSQSARSEHLEGCPEYRSSTETRSDKTKAPTTETASEEQPTTDEEGSTNSGSDTFKCDYCDSTHPSKSDLTTHTIDCDERPSDAYFECEYCHNRYVSKQGLTDHLENCTKKRRTRSSTETEDHECDHCGDVFKYAHELSKHEHSCSEAVGSQSSTHGVDDSATDDLTGYVSHYNVDDGYGFISTSDLDRDSSSGSQGSTDVFFHVSSYPGESPEENDRLRFDVEENEEGFEAVNITFNRTKPPEGWDDTFASDRKQWGDNS